MVLCWLDVEANISFINRELITKDKLVTIRDSSADVSSDSKTIRSDEGLSLETSALESLMVTNLSLVINSLLIKEIFM